MTPLALIFIVSAQQICLLCLFLLILFVWFSCETPLHLSAEKGHLEICRLLLQCNANPSEQEFYL